MTEKEKIQKKIVESLKLCMKDNGKVRGDDIIVYENDITMRIFYVFYKDKYLVCSQTRYGEHYNDLTILGKKNTHIIEVKNGSINKSFKKDSKKRFPKATKWIVSFWIGSKGEGSEIPQRKTLSKIKTLIVNNKNIIIIHGTSWDNDKVIKLKESAQDLGFEMIKTRNINKSKWRVVLFYCQNNKPVLKIIKV